MSEKEIQKLDRSMADACMRRVKSMEQQNAKLMAHIEDSKHVMMVVANCDTKETANLIADKWIEQTPQQSLANIKADAIEEALNSCFPDSAIYTAQMAGYISTLKSELTNYANQIIGQSK